MSRILALILFTLAALLFGAQARAQDLYGPPVPGDAAPVQSVPQSIAALTAGAMPQLPADPLSLVDSASRSSPALSGGLSGAMSVLLLLTVLSLVPAIMVMCTCFVRFIVVLGLLKQALGTQSLPPAQVVTALALFMTLLVMAPTLERIHTEALAPYQRGDIVEPGALWEKARQPIRDFMFAQIEATDSWSSVYMVLNARGIDTSAPEKLRRADVDMLSLIPAYMLSELKTSFLMGFRVYLPFLIIDMVIASLLISMSMMMLPPVLISLPFKLLLFVLVDGWQLVVGSLMASVAQPGAGPAGSGGGAAASGAVSSAHTLLSSLGLC